MKSNRTISQIANEIQKEWGKVHPNAAPYLNVMKSLNTINDMYGYDSARSIVNYFLANASAFRGDKAKQLKAELKSLL